MFFSPQHVDSCPCPPSSSSSALDVLSTLNQPTSTSSPVPTVTMSAAEFWTLIGILLPTGVLSLICLFVLVKVYGCNRSPSPASMIPLTPMSRASSSVYFSPPPSPSSAGNNPFLPLRVPS